jgi:predicted phosphodiesterase
MNKIAVIADIHSNLKALNKAIETLEKEKVDKIFVCGDVVGYGKDPNECCNIIRKLRWPVVAGNHDWAVAGKTEYEDSHSETAVRGINETKRIITPGNQTWLKSLKPHYVKDEMEFVHSSLVDSEKWYYLTLGSTFKGSVWQDVRDNFDVMKGQVCFVGHTHIPVIFLEITPKNIKVISPDKDFYELGGKRAIINVGSIGQPRTSSKKASLVIYDRETQKIRVIRF